MKHLFSIFLIGCVLLTGCRRASTSTSASETELYTPSYASGFSISKAGDGESSIITVRNPWQGADSVQLRLFISRNDELAPDGFVGQVVKGDARRIVAMSSTHVAMLDAVDKVQTIKGVSGLDYISNPWINAHRDSVADIGFEGNIDYECLLALQPDVVLLYGINSASPMETKLQELGIPYMYVGDYLEESPLGKAEWMVALAELCGVREQGVEKFAPVAEQYNELKTKVEAVDIPAKLVMLNMPYGDAWFMPPVGNYIVRLISDAGGQYVYEQHTGTESLPIDIEEALQLVGKSDVWLNVGQAASMADVAAACPEFVDSELFRSGEVYNNNARLSPTGGNDFFESGVVNPHLVLRDIIKILNPDLVEDPFTYYRNLD